MYLSALVWLDLLANFLQVTLTPYISREVFRKDPITLENGCRDGKIVSGDIPVIERRC